MLNTNIGPLHLGPYEAPVSRWALEQSQVHLYSLKDLVYSNRIFYSTQYRSKFSPIV